MKSTKRVAIAFSLCLLCCSRAGAWQQQGHAIIAALAEQMISPKTKESIDKLLREAGDKDLVSIASWADEVILAGLNEGAPPG
jgi:S1/P1 Nuclease